MRSGIGYDVHRFAEGRRLVLGGVEIPSERGLLGHSDADVLVHAIADAILGAAGLPDIGFYFPPDDMEIEGMASTEILKECGRLVREAGFDIENVDSTLIAEAPKISPHIAAMKSALSVALSVEPSRIGIKATTNEQMGFIGRGEGIAALAVCSLRSDA